MSEFDHPPKRPTGDHERHDDDDERLPIEGGTVSVEAPVAEFVHIPRMRSTLRLPRGVRQVFFRCENRSSAKPRPVRLVGNRRSGDGIEKVCRDNPYLQNVAGCCRQITIGLHRKQDAALLDLE